MVIVETESLTHRHLEPGDLVPLFTRQRDPDVRRCSADGTCTLEETREDPEWFFLGHPRRAELVGPWATIERSTGAFLGRCLLLPWTSDGVPEVELAYLIDKARWGEGFASEAARAIVRYAREELRLERLVCLITPGNAASARVATKVGMASEREYTDECGPCHIFSRSLSGGAQGRTSTERPHRNALP